MKEIILADNTPFTDQEVEDLFAWLNGDKKLSSMLAGLYAKKLRPCRGATGFADPRAVASLVSTPKFNATCTLEIAGVYDQGFNRQGLDGKAQMAAAAFLKQLNSALKSHPDPKYRALVASIVNRQIEAICVHEDMSDDGNDVFGAQLFLKIAWRSFVR